MNETRNKRKAEIKVLLDSIEKLNNERREAQAEANEFNFQTAIGFIPELKALTLKRFEIENYSFDEDKAPKYRFDFQSSNSASFSIDIKNKKVDSYSVTGCSDRNIDPSDFAIVKNFYSDVYVIMDIFSSKILMESFYELAETFQIVKYEDYKNGLDEYQLKQELSEIERQEKIEALDLKVGSIVQYYTETKYRSTWIIVKIKKITAKRFVYVQYSVEDKKWLDENGNTYYDTNATIDYNRFKELDENQKAFFKE
jgi:hypothetical protein